MATTKYQGFPTYRYAQIALSPHKRSVGVFQGVQISGTTTNTNTSTSTIFRPKEDEVETEQKKEVAVNIPEEMISQPILRPNQVPTQHDYSAPEKDQELEVNYENNVTALYEAISNSQWDLALQTLNSNPSEARTWVVRYKEDNTKGIMWRFLPLHSACARQPPKAVISSLLQAYPEGAGSCDDQGMYPLHYASGNQASAEVIRLLTQAFSPAASTCDPSGMLPIHYMAQWGPSETKAIDSLLLANHQTNVKDDQNHTPLHYAEEGEYPFRQEMIAALKKGPISNIPKKKFQPILPSSLPPMSTRRNSNSSHSPSAATDATAAPAAPVITLQPSISSNISKLDDSTVASNFAASSMKAGYGNRNNDENVNT